MSDRDKVLGDQLFGVLVGYISILLHDLAGLVVTWLTPRVSRALEWLHARLPKRATVAQLSGVSYAMSAAHGSFAITVPSAELRFNAQPVMANDELAFPAR